MLPLQENPHADSIHQMKQCTKSGQRDFMHCSIQQRLSACGLHQSAGISSRPMSHIKCYLCPYRGDVSFSIWHLSPRKEIRKHLTNEETDINTKFSASVVDVALQKDHTLWESMPLNCEMWIVLPIAMNLKRNIWKRFYLFPESLARVISEVQSGQYKLLKGQVHKVYLVFSSRWFKHLDSAGLLISGTHWCSISTVKFLQQSLSSAVCNTFACSK